MNRFARATPNLPGLALSLLLCAAMPAHADERAARVFTEVSGSIVTVVVYKNDTAIGYGSGVVVAPGKIATNNHVAAAGTRLEIKHRGQILRAEMESTSAGHDLALLTVYGLTAAPATLGGSGSLKVGQTLYAVGSSKGLEPSLSEGLVSSLRTVEDGVLIQTTAPVSPGSSGGGLFDEQGRLVGLTTAQILDGQSLNFAIPVDWLRYIGIRPDPNPAAQAAPETVAAETPQAVPSAPRAPAQKPAAAAKYSFRLYVMTALIVFLLVLAKPATDWLAELMSRETLPPVARHARPVAATDRLAPFRKLAREEIKSGQRDAETWLRALEQSGGEETPALVAYMQIRAQALYKAALDRRRQAAKADAEQASMQPRKPTL